MHGKTQPQKMNLILPSVQNFFLFFCLNVDEGSSSTTLSFLKTPYLVDIKDILKISNYTLCFSEQLSLHFLYHEENLNHPIKLSFWIAAKILF